MTTIPVQMLMHTLHLKFGWRQVLAYSLSLRNDVPDFIFDGRFFHIFGPKNLKLWEPNLLALICLTMMSLSLTFMFFLGMNIFFMKRV